MLGQFPIHVDLPAADLARARTWYEDKLALTPSMESFAGLLYLSGGVLFRIYLTASAGTARNTAATWLVDDLSVVMAELRSRGIAFEDYSLGDDGPTTVDGVASSPGGGSTAWFRDSEGNILAISQLPRGFALPGRGLTRSGRARPASIR